MLNAAFLKLTAQAAKPYIQSGYILKKKELRRLKGFKSGGDYFIGFNTAVRLPRKGREYLLVFGDYGNGFIVIG